MVTGLRDALDVLERNDGRHDYLLYDGERCLRSLSEVGRDAVELPISRDRTTDYLAALDDVNDQYFDARAFENEVRGKFYKHDDDAERRLRSAVAEAASDCVEGLRRLLAVHDAAVESIRSNATDGDSSEGDRSGATRRLCLNTNRAVREAWYPVVQSYDHALDPGERVAEGKKRRRQRAYGQESIPGVAQLLDTPLFEQVTDDDLGRVTELDAYAPTDGRRVARRLVERHRWLLADRG